MDEILEVERRLGSRVMDPSPFHFDLHNLDYTRETDAARFTKKGEYRLLQQGYVELPSQVEIEDVAIEYERAVTGQHTIFRTQIAHKTYSLEEVGEELYRRLQSIDEESKNSADPKERTQYAKKFTRKRCLEIVTASARKAKIKSGRITEENRQKILQALGPLKRKTAKRVVYKLTPRALKTISTRERPAISCSAAEIRRGDKTAFIPPDCESSIPDEQIEFFREVEDPDGDFRAGREILSNAHDFKTPCNMTIADSTPERKFVRQLCERQNAVALDAWIKSAPQRYYVIEYAWKKGEHPKRGEFSPDFFIKKGDMVYVVEIKDDSEIEDPSLEESEEIRIRPGSF